MEDEISFGDDRFEVKLTGRATTEDCHRYIDALTSHAQWKPGSLVLSDETDLEVRNLSIEQIRAIAQICGSRKDIFGPARIATYVQSELGFGMSRMFQAHAEIEWHARTWVFKTRAEALTWLSIQSTSADC